jgi:hypothetical protein
VWRVLLDASLLMWYAGSFFTFAFLFIIERYKRFELLEREEKKKRTLASAEAATANHPHAAQHKHRRTPLRHTMNLLFPGSPVAAVEAESAILVSRAHEHTLVQASSLSSAPPARSGIDIVCPNPLASPDPGPGRHDFELSTLPVGASSAHSGPEAHPGQVAQWK